MKARLLLVGLWLAAAPAAADETLEVAGLKAPVEILTDRWGVAHIYAQNEHDLFFAQGYNAARIDSSSSRSGAAGQPGPSPRSWDAANWIGTSVLGCTCFARACGRNSITTTRAVRRSSVRMSTESTPTSRRRRTNPSCSRLNSSYSASPPASGRRPW